MNKYFNDVDLELLNSLTEDFDDDDDLELLDSIINKNDYDLQNYDFWLREVKDNGIKLKYVPIELIDREMCLEACIQDNNAFKYIPSELTSINFIKDLKNYINNGSLSDFKKENLYYFQTILENLKDNSINFNDCLKNLDIKDLEDSKVIDALVERFNQYEFSRDYNLDELKKEPNELLNIIKSINFNKEFLKKDIKIYNELN